MKKSNKTINLVYKSGDALLSYYSEKNLFKQATPHHNGYTEISYHCYFTSLY